MAKTNLLFSGTSKVPTPSTSSLGIYPSFRDGTCVSVVARSLMFQREQLTALLGAELRRIPLPRTQVNCFPLRCVCPLLLLNDELSYMQPSDLKLLYVEALDPGALHSKRPDRQSTD